MTLNLESTEIDRLKGIIKTAHEAAKDEKDESYKMEVFKIVLGKLLDEHLVNSVQRIPAGTPPAGTPPAGTPPDNTLELVTKCRITVDELKNVFLIKDKKVEIVRPIEGKDPKKMIIAAQCVLAVHEVIFGQEWVQAHVLTDCFRGIGIKNPGHNLAAHMKNNSDLFLKRTNASEYRLTTDKGRISAFETIRKLAKREVMA